MAHHKVVQGVNAFIAAGARYKARRAAYLREPHPWATEHEAILARLREDRERDEAKARAMIGDGVAELEATANVSRPKANPVEVASAWSRIEKMLDAGRGVDEIVGRSDFNRVDAQALVENIGARLAVALADEDNVAIEWATKQALRMIETAEMRLMPEHERAGVEAARELQVLREEVEPEVIRLGQTDIASAEEMLRFGYAISAIPGYVPSEPNVDRARAAEAARNSMPQEQRDALDANARQVGYRSNESGFGSGAEGGS